MFSIYDGRTQFYQWDLDRKLVVDDPTIKKVHFCNRTRTYSLVRCVYEVNGMFLVDVPNIILQESYRVNVYGFDTNYTKYSQSFNIVARTRPEDYIYTEDEVAQWEALEERITQIEENYATKTYVNQQIANAQLGSEGGSIDLSDYYTKAQTDAAINAAKPDLTGYATQSWVEGKGYLTQHQDLSKYALKTEIPSLDGYAKTTDIPDVSGYQTAEQVNAAINTAIASITNGEEVSY